MVIEYFFEPLEKLKIILILALDKFFDIDIFHDAKLGEVLLEKLKVSDILIIIFGLEVDFGEGDFIGIEEVEHLAVDSAGAKLLDFGEVGAEQLVDPGEQVPAGQLDCVVGVYAYLVDHLRVVI